MTALPALSPVTQVYHYAYISTGKKSAMFTLWRGRSAPGLIPLRDHYICNLTAADVDPDNAINQERAEQKAQDYCDRMSERMGVTVHFEGVEDEPRNTRRGKLSVRDTIALEKIEAGFFPFGKHQGTSIANAPDGYLLWWADRHAEADHVVAALSAVCMGFAMERDLIAKRDAARAERAAEDAKSEFVGTVGQRMEFTGEVVTAFDRKGPGFEGEDCVFFTITKVRVGDDLITYIGGRIAEKGETIRFKGTVKRHDTYQGVKSTVISRPHVIKDKTA